MQAIKIILSLQVKNVASGEEVLQEVGWIDFYC
jgi:hypothetical protein